MILSEAFRAAQDGPLIARFTAAVWRAATDIVNEDPDTAQHAERIEWAKRALIQDGKAQAYAFIITRLAFSENGTLQAAWSPTEGGSQVTDNDVLFVVNSYVEKLVAAGV